MSHEGYFEAKFLARLGEMDAAYAEHVHAAGCPHCGGPLDRADYPRKPRGELGEAAGAYERRLSFCCRREGCRKRATPPSLRFLGRKVYVAVVVVVASAAGQAARLFGRGRAGRVCGVPVRTVRRWLEWWRGDFPRSGFWTEAKAFFATPVVEEELPASLVERFGAASASALGNLLSFTAPITTTSFRARIVMAV